MSELSDDWSKKLTAASYRLDSWEAELAQRGRRLDHLSEATVRHTTSPYAVRTEAQPWEQSPTRPNLLGGHRITQNDGPGSNYMQQPPSTYSAARTPIPSRVRPAAASPAASMSSPHAPSAPAEVGATAAMAKAVAIHSALQRVQNLGSELQAHGVGLHDQVARAQAAQVTAERQLAAKEAELQARMQEAVELRAALSAAQKLSEAHSHAARDAAAQLSAAQSELAAARGAAQAAVKDNEVVRAELGLLKGEMAAVQDALSAQRTLRALEGANAAAAESAAVTSSPRAMRALAGLRQQAEAVSGELRVLKAERAAQEAATAQVRAELERLRAENAMLREVETGAAAKVTAASRTTSKLQAALEEAISGNSVLRQRVEAAEAAAAGQAAAVSRVVAENRVLREQLQMALVQVEDMSEITAAATAEAAAAVSSPSASPRQLGGPAHIHTPHTSTQFRASPTRLWGSHRGVISREGGGGDEGLQHGTTDEDEMPLDQYLRGNSILIEAYRRVKQELLHAARAVRDARDRAADAEACAEAATARAGAAETRVAAAEAQAGRAEMARAEASAEASAETATLHGEITALKARLEAARQELAELDTLRAQLAAARTQIHILEADKVRGEEACAELAAKTTELARHQSDLEHASAMLEDARSTQANLTEQLSTATSELRRVTAFVEGKDRAVASLQEQLDAVTQQAREASSRVSALTAELGALRNAHEAAQAETANLLASNSTANTQLGKAEEAARQAEAELRRVRGLLGAAEARAEHASAQAEAAAGQLEALLRRVERADGAASEASSRAAAADARAARADSCAEAAERRAAEAEARAARLAEAQAAAEHDAKAVAMLLERFGEEGAALEAAVADRQAISHGLRSRMEAVKEAVSSKLSLAGSQAAGARLAQVAAERLAAQQGREVASLQQRLAFTQANANVASIFGRLTAPASAPALRPLGGTPDSASTTPRASSTFQAAGASGSLSVGFSSGSQVGPSPPRPAAPSSPQQQAVATPRYTASPGSDHLSDAGLSTSTTALLANFDSASPLQRQAAGQQRVGASAEGEPGPQLVHGAADAGGNTTTLQASYTYAYNSQTHDSILSLQGLGSSPVRMQGAGKGDPKHPPPLHISHHHHHLSSRNSRNNQEVDDLPAEVITAAHSAASTSSPRSTGGTRPASPSPSTGAHKGSLPQPSRTPPPTARYSYGQGSDGISFTPPPQAAAPPPAPAVPTQPFPPARPDTTLSPAHHSPSPGDNLIEIKKAASATLGRGGGGPGSVAATVATTLVNVGSVVAGAAGATADCPYSPAFSMASTQRSILMGAGGTRATMDSDNGALEGGPSTHHLATVVEEDELGPVVASRAARQSMETLLTRARNLTGSGASRDTAGSPAAAPAFRGSAPALGSSSGRFLFGGGTGQAPGSNGSEGSAAASLEGSIAARLAAMNDALASLTASNSRDTS